MVVADSAVVQTPYGVFRRSHAAFVLQDYKGLPKDFGSMVHETDFQTKMKRVGESIQIARANRAVQPSTYV